MKNIISLMFFVLLLINQVTAQDKFKFEKLSKDVKKEGKRYEKEGWTVFPGTPPIDQQLNNAFTKQAETDDNNFPKWIIANGSSLAQTQAAAEMQATELAKNNIVAMIESNIGSVIESDVSNNQLDSKDAVSLTKTIQVSSNKVSKKLGRVMPIFKVYRSVNKNVEVQIMIGYNYDLVRKQVLEEMKSELQNETEEVRKKYEKYFNPEFYNQGEIKNFDDGSK